MNGDVWLARCWPAACFFFLNRTTETCSSPLIRYFIEEETLPNITKRKKKSDYIIKDGVFSLSKATWLHWERDSSLNRLTCRKWFKRARLHWERDSTLNRLTWRNWFKHARLHRERDLTLNQVTCRKWFKHARMHWESESTLNRLTCRSAPVPFSITRKKRLTT